MSLFHRIGFFAHAHFQIYNHGEILPVEIGLHSVLKKGEWTDRKYGLWTIFHFKDTSPEVTGTYLAETSTLPPGYMGFATQEIAEMLAVARVEGALVAVQGPVQRDYFQKMGMNVVDIGFHPQYSSLPKTVKCYHDEHADPSQCCFAITKEIAMYIERYRDLPQEVEETLPKPRPSSPDLDHFLDMCSSAEAYIPPPREPPTFLDLCSSEEAYIPPPREPPTFLDLCSSAEAYIKPPRDLGLSRFFQFSKSVL